MRYVFLLLLLASLLVPDSILHGWQPTSPEQSDGAPAAQSQTLLPVPAPAPAPGPAQSINAVDYAAPDTREGLDEALVEEFTVKAPVRAGLPSREEAQQN